MMRIVIVRCFSSIDVNQGYELALYSVEENRAASEIDSPGHSGFAAITEGFMQSSKIIMTLLMACAVIATTCRAEAPRAGPDVALFSVGKLLVPGQRYENGYTRHYDESCSATLITKDPHALSSNLVVSAWHCLEFYHDTSKAVSFEASGGETRGATLVASGGGMHSDWALLRLSAPLPSPAILNDYSDGDIESLMMAGYPRQDSNKPKTLETASDCQVTGIDGADVRSNCVLKKGASGGGVFADQRGHRYLGVISRGDGESQSIFVPLARFREKIDMHTTRFRLP